MPRLFYLSLVLLALAAPALAQDDPGRGTRLLRQPTISERHVVFVYADDLWTADAAGGEARRLTSAVGTESRPHVSPDGRMVAFTAEYDGNVDAYAVPVEGGQPQRLTWHPAGDDVQGWTPDGRVLFVSSRESRPTQESRFYTIGLDGGMPEALPIPRAAAGEVSEDGRFAAYQLVSFWDPEWRNYRGGQAKPIWIVDLETLDLERAPQLDRERHTDPVWLDGVVYYLSERDYANNVWRYDPATDAEEQLTFHADFDVKSLDAGGGRIVYEQGGYLHVLDPTTKATRPLVVHVRGDLVNARERWEDVRPAALENASLSPTGQRALFEYRGELFTVPKDAGDPRNLTQSSGAADRSPVWSPQGDRIAWFSDEGGEYALVIGDQFGRVERTIELEDPTFFFRPAWSPDGARIAFTDTHYRLWVVEVETGEAAHVDTDRYAHPNRTMNPVWSPDSRWIAYARLLDNQFKAIVVHNVETGAQHLLTDGMADAVDPVWDASGKYLYFLASTDYGLSTGWLDMSSYDRPVTRALYAILLADGTPSPFLPTSDEEPTDEEGDEESTDEEGDEEDERGEGEEALEDVVVRIDPESIATRIVGIDMPEKDYAGLVAGPEGHVFVLESVPDQPGYTLHRYSLEDREATEVMKPVQFATASHDRESLLYRSNATWGIVPTTGTAKPGDGALDLGDVRVKVVPQEEWAQIFREGWRFQRDFLYVDNQHGAPWQEVYAWYRPWVDHVRHRSDLNYVVDILGGEIAVGHSYTSGGDVPDVERVPVGLLGADLEEADGYVRIAKVYAGDTWNPDLRGPLAHPGAEVRAGEYLLAVDGRPLRAGSNPFRLFEGTAGRQTRLRVNDRPSEDGAREVVVVPVSSDYQLRIADWVEGNRKRVEELSDGQLAYVWLPNTGRGGYNNFNRYYFAQQDRRGAVIDERNNGGGSAADYIVDVLARDLHGYFNSRAGDRRPFTTPMAGLWGPKVMIVNERAGSGGDLMPYLFRKMEIGPLVGTRTWGGLVGTWDTPRFIDGGRMVAPRGGFFDVHGEWAVEADGVAPDIEVIQHPREVAAGRDPQLERAVQEALRLVETEGVTLREEPPPPVRWRRPAGGSDE